jgi:DNA-binding beta-propeller fold protein YncE
VAIGAPSALLASPDGKKIYIGRSDGIGTWDVRTQQFTAGPSIGYPYGGGLASMVWWGNVVAFTTTREYSGMCNVLLYNPSTDKVGVLGYADSCALAVTPDGRLLYYDQANIREWRHDGAYRDLVTGLAARPVTIAADTVNLYWADSSYPGKVNKVATPSSGATVAAGTATILGQVPSTPGNAEAFTLAVGYGQAFWPARCAVERYNLEDGSHVLLFGTVHSCGTDLSHLNGGWTGVAMAGGDLYIADFGNGRVLRLPAR